MKKVVVKLNLHDNESKQKAMRAVSSLEGLTSLSLNTKDSTMTVIGEVDPVQVVKKLRKWYQQIDTVGPVKDEKKDDKKDGGDKKVEASKTEKEQVAALVKGYNPYQVQFYPVQSQYYPVVQSQYYPVHSIEENPNACVIC